MASPEPAQRPLISIHTDGDDKVDAKVPLDQLPPSYQDASEAAPPPPADPDSDQSGCCRRRRRCRRFGHFLVALFFLWLTARFVVRHCQLRRFAHPHPHSHHDGFSWVRSLAIPTRSN